MRPHAGDMPRYVATRSSSVLDGDRPHTRLNENNPCKSAALATLHLPYPTTRGSVNARRPGTLSFALANRLHSIIKKGHEARTPFERQHFAFLEQMHGTIEGLKNAWRNKISHAHGKLTLLSSDFSPEIAEEILFATRAFMRRLATDAPVVLGEQPS
jgi:hypothetical protein